MSKASVIAAIQGQIAACKMAIASIEANIQKLENAKKSLESLIVTLETSCNENMKQLKDCGNFAGDNQTSYEGIVDDGIKANENNYMFKVNAVIVLIQLKIEKLKKEKAELEQKLHELMIQLMIAMSAAEDEDSGRSGGGGPFRGGSGGGRHGGIGGGRGR